MNNWTMIHGIAVVSLMAAAACSAPPLDFPSPSGPGKGGAGGNNDGGATPGMTGNAGSGGQMTGGDAGSGGLGGAAGAGGLGGAAGAGGQGTAAQGVEITLKSGAKARGQLLHEYDHSIWWFNPTKEKTLALFDPAKFADYPDDHSIDFLSSFDITSIEDVALPAGTVLYRDLLRTQGILMKQMPVDGPLYVGNGNEGYHLEENGHGDFAWDLARTGADGKRFKGTGQANDDYLIWDAPIHLPMAGRVIEVVRDAADNPAPGDYALDAENNMVGLHVGGQFYLYLLHMREGTIPDEVKPGATLPQGALIGRVGNSGASVEPHLHIALLWYDEVTKRSWGVPSEWAQVWASGSASGSAALHDYLVPQTGTWISSDKF